MDAAGAVRFLLASSASKGKSPAAHKAPFVPLAPLESGPVAAVDGSHAVLVDNGSVWVVATRAGCTAWPGPRMPLEPEFHASAVANAQAAIDEAYARHGFRAPRVANATSWAEAWRALREFEACQGALDPREPKIPLRLLLLDGALHGLPAGPQEFADRLLEESAVRGVALVGVAKRSALEQDGGSLVQELQARGPSGPWRTEVAPGVHVAKLHSRATHAFRIDTPTPEVLGALVPLSRDAAYVGYPYPLAVAHNRVALTAGVVAELKARLAVEARSRGGVAGARLLADFHDVLDRNVPA